MEPLKEKFLDDLRNIMGLFSDAVQGFHFFREHLLTSSMQTIEMLKKSSPEHANKEYLDNVTYSYGEEITPVHKVGLVTHHEITHINTTSYKDLIERNSSGGENYFLIGNLTIVMIYHLWENTYRLEFEKQLNKKIEADVFGDLAQIRHMILKNNGVLNQKAYKKFRLIKWYETGDRIILDSQKLSEITKWIEAEVKNFR